jgi:hypothetical protein
MEIISESSLGDEVREAIRRAQEAKELIEITDEQGEVIARLIPAISAAHNRA